MRSRFRLLIALLLSVPVGAHMVSISTGEINIDGLSARYQFRVPLYEIPHLKEPEKALLGAIRFSSGGVDARQTEGKCRQDSNENALICEAVYQFSAPVDVLDVVSSFHSVTVPNHVHLLRATKGGVTDQAVLDLSFPKAQVRFRPPTLLEAALQQSGAGMLRAVGGAAQWLFVLALMLAASGRKELALFALMFIAGEIASCLILPLTGWTPAPGFVEAAAALTVAYLCVEILFLPGAGQRAVVILVLGAFHGLYFSLFITSSDFRPYWVLAGVALAELGQIALVAWLFSWIRKPLAALHPVSVTAAVLLAVSLAWFFLRLRA